MMADYSSTVVLDNEKVSLSYTGMVRLDVYFEDVIWGYISSPYIPKPISCADSGAFLLTLCELFDALRCPSADVVYRSFDKQQLTKPLKTVMYGNPEDYNLYAFARSGTPPQEAYCLQKRKPETFMMHVLYRQNASLQGNIIWMNKKRSFRSGIELLYLINSAINRTT